MLIFILLFGLFMACAGFYVAFDNNRSRKEKLAKIQRELVRGEAAERAELNEAAETQD